MDTGSKVKMLHIPTIFLIFMNSVLFQDQIQIDFWLPEDMQFAVGGYVGPRNCPFLLPYIPSPPFLMTVYHDQSTLLYHIYPSILYKVCIFMNV